MEGIEVVGWCVGRKVGQEELREGTEEGMDVGMVDEEEATNALLEARREFISALWWPSPRGQGV